MSASRSVLVKLAKGSVLAIPDPLALTRQQGDQLSYRLRVRAPAMNAFYARHEDSIRFGYRCFDRILLNRLIQPFQSDRVFRYLSVLYVKFGCCVFFEL